jgi:hypothetical protein
LEKLADVPEGIVALRAVGTVTRQDYEETVEPIVDEVLGRGGRMRLLMQLGPEYEGFTVGAAWEKAENWFRHPTMLRAVDGYALVSDIGWVREFVGLSAFLLPFPMRVFGNDERDQAVAWLSSVPGAGATEEPAAGGVRP